LAVACSWKGSRLLWRIKAQRRIIENQADLFESLLGYSGAMDEVVWGTEPLYDGGNDTIFWCVLAGPGWQHCFGVQYTYKNEGNVPEQLRGSLQGGLTEEAIKLLAEITRVDQVFDVSMATSYGGPAGSIRKKGAPSKLVIAYTKRHAAE
jgi:hypothetical protein